MIADKLKRGDKVALISPSNPVADRLDVVKKAIDNFEKQTGLEVVVGKYALGQHYYASGTVQQRLDDLHDAIRNPEIKAVLFSVGGSVAIDLIERIDYDLIASNPKIVAGISDGTTLTTQITKRTGLVTFLGIEFLQYAEYDMTYQLESIQKAWFEGKSGAIQQNKNWKDFKGEYNTYDGWQCIQPGIAKGKIVGGNASCFGYYLNTDKQPSLKGNILVMETYKKPKKELHRILAEYRLRGAFDEISGLIIGYCVGADDPGQVGSDRPLADVVIEAVNKPKLPIIHIGEIGHHVANIMLPIGVEAEFNSDELSFRITEPVTS